MKLTKSSDFALRLIIYLAEQAVPVAMPRIAKDIDIPYHHLAKLVQCLSKNKIVQTFQGKYGGVSLLADPKNLNLKHVIELIDGPVMLTQCLEDKSSCKLTPICKLKLVFHEIQTKINRIFEQTYLDEIIHKEVKLKKVKA